MMSWHFGCYIGRRWLGFFMESNRLWGDYPMKHEIFSILYTFGVGFELWGYILGSMFKCYEGAQPGELKAKISPCIDLAMSLMLKVHKIVQ